MERIDKQAAIDALWKALHEYEDKTEKQFQESEDLDVEDWIEHRIFVQNMNDIDRQTILNLPSAQPERLTDDDFETTRIHLNAYKEKLCNQHRWKEAEEYQRIIDRFIAFASAQPEIIRCIECRWGREPCGGNIECFVDANVPPEYHRDDWFCPNGERRTEE